MRHYYTADEIREAGHRWWRRCPTMACTTGRSLATAIAENWRCTGGISGRRVCAVVGSGDNGGDALWAATFISPWGAAAVLLSPSAPTEGRWPLHPGRGRIENRPRTADLVMTGLVNIRGRAVATQCGRGVHERVCSVVAVINSIDVQTGADGPHARDSTVTFGG
jgi:NAD(P)H-hydrate repair Nnr-like enzyme with NAD(P)H-hydrate epimerase domain